MHLKDRISRNNFQIFTDGNSHNNSKSPRNHSGNGHSAGKGKTGEACRLYNRGHCKFGASCRFPHKCSYCNKFSHTVLMCRKLVADREKSQSKTREVSKQPKDES